MTMASRNAMRAIGQLVRRSKVRLAPKAVEVKPAEAAAAGAKPPCVFSTEAFGTSAEAFVPPFDLDLCRSEVRVNVGTAGRTPKQVRASSDMDWPLLGAEIERVDSDSPAAAEEGCQKEVRGLFEFYLRRADARGVARGGASCGTAACACSRGSSRLDSVSGAQRRRRRRWRRGPPAASRRGIQLLSSPTPCSDGSKG